VREPESELSARITRVRHEARPWRSIIALVLAIAAAVISRQARPESHTFSTNHLTSHIIQYCTAALFGGFGSMATYGLAGQARGLLEPRLGTAHAAVARYAVLIIGAFTTLVITLDLFDVPVTQLVLGGALTSVFVGIAAQQALGNVFAGLVLFARPFHAGDAIRLQAGALGGTLDGTVVDIGITYVRLEAAGGVMAIPNSQVLNAVIGPIPPAEEDAAPAPAVVSGKSSTPGGPEKTEPAPSGSA
jgi:small-conductance mechanosensitive channel